MFLFTVTVFWIRCFLLGQTVSLYDFFTVVLLYFIYFFCLVFFSLYFFAKKQHICLARCVIWSWCCELYIIIFHYFLFWLLCNLHANYTAVVSVVFLSLILWHCVWSIAKQRILGMSCGKKWVDRPNDQCVLWHVFVQGIAFWVSRSVIGKIISKTISNQNRLSKNDLKSKSLFSKWFQIKIMFKMIFKIEIIQMNLLAFLQCSETVSLSVITVTHSGLLST